MQAGINDLKYKMICLYTPIPFYNTTIYPSRKPKGIFKQYKEKIICLDITKKKRRVPKPIRKLMQSIRRRKSNVF